MSRASHSTARKGQPACAPPRAEKQPRIALLDPADRVRRLIAESLEDGLLRYTSREAILREARQLGFSDFHTHLLIAQAQHGDRRPLTFGLIDPPAEQRQHRRDAARLGGVVVLALALFLLAARWLTL